MTLFLLQTIYVTKGIFKELVRTEKSTISKRTKKSFKLLGNLVQDDVLDFCKKFMLSSIFDSLLMHFERDYCDKLLQFIKGPFLDKMNELLMIRNIELPEKKSVQSTKFRNFNFKYQPRIVFNPHTIQKYCDNEQNLSFKPSINHAKPILTKLPIELKKLQESFAQNQMSIQKLVEESSRLAPKCSKVSDHRSSLIETEKLPQNNLDTNFFQRCKSPDYLVLLYYFDFKI